MRITKSYILLHNVCFHAYIGVGEQERSVGNAYMVNLKIEYPLANSLSTDSVEDTLNYASVYQLLKEEMAIPAKLLEYKAGMIAKKLFDTFTLIASLEIKITKLNPPMGADCSGASVEILFERDA